MVERGDMYAWNKRPRWWTNIGRRSALVVVVIMLTLPSCMGSDRDYKTIWAHVNYTYRDPDTNKLVNESDRGEFGTKSLEEHREGIVMHVHDKENTSKGCTEYTNKIPQVPWIALIERGGCEFSQKIKMATQTYNASAVVVYNFKEATNKDLITMNLTKHNVKAQVSIFMSRETGKKLAKLADSGVLVEMTIRPGEKKSSTANDTNSISKTSVLFVSISFIVLMIISLAWLIFYYIQRFRYAHAKERLARRLTSAAKKAISKIPQKMVKNGDRELDSEFDQCAVCIEGYKPHDVIRILPCKHVFHKSCVDPWLLDQRSCPMCKLDILRAYGMQVMGSQESVRQDVEAGGGGGGATGGGGGASGDGDGDDAEASTATDEASAAPDTEVKVLLLPHTCLHIHNPDHHPPPSPSTSTSQEPPNPQPRGMTVLSSWNDCEMQALMAQHDMEDDEGEEEEEDGRGAEETERAAANTDTVVQGPVAT